MKLNVAQLFACFYNNEKKKITAQLGSSTAFKNCHKKGGRGEARFFLSIVQMSATIYKSEKKGDWKYNLPEPNCG
jgi:hypothetical protein